MLGAKLHGATITEANLEYMGSISIDAGLLRTSGILPFEQVDVYNLDNGERLTTYAIEGGPGEICLNGAAAHKGAAGQRVIIAAYRWLDEKEIGGHRPRVLIMNKDNSAAEVVDHDVPAP
jgi:aspartate 1-decarboxylase